jgi:hypothetical protein
VDLLVILKNIFSKSINAKQSMLFRDSLSVLLNRFASHLPDTVTFLSDPIFQEFIHTTNSKEGMHGLTVQQYLDMPGNVRFMTGVSPLCVVTVM